MAVYWPPNHRWLLYGHRPPKPPPAGMADAGAAETGDTRILDATDQRFNRADRYQIRVIRQSGGVGVAQHNQSKTAT